jgi:hypothetical protein
MALPSSYGPVQTDEQGRRYVVHKPTGIIYYIREEYTAAARRAKAGPVIKFSRHPNASKPAKPAAKHRPPHYHTAPEFARATFIEGSAP